MPLVAFVDNDVILKLAACNLFWEAVNTLGLTKADLRVLPQAQYVFRNSGTVQQIYPQPIRDNAIRIVQACMEIQPQPSQELRYLEIEGIDSGESILIAATRHEVSFYLITGDKQCLEALALSPQLVEIKHRLIGRVICLEQLILKLIDTQGFNEVLTKVLPAIKVIKCDMSLGAIFGSGERATQENVLQALEGYIEDLRKNTEGFLAVRIQV